MKKTNFLARRKYDETDTEYVIDALVLPYGGHKANNRDCHNQRFGETTDFKTSVLPLPPVVYAHGFPIDPEGVADRTVVGRTVSRWYDSSGGWAKLAITKDTPLAAEVMESYRQGTLKFSSTALLAALNREDQSLYDVWLVGEFSVVTHKTPVPACNLLTRAGEYGKMAMADIMSALPSDEERAELQRLLDESDGANDNQPAGEADEAELRKLAESGDEDDDMKPEELQAALTTALAPVLARIGELETKAAAPPKPPDAKPEPQKTDGDLAAFIGEKAERLKTDGAAQTMAATLIDGYINAAQVKPEERTGMITLAMAAINADGRRKVENGALAAFISTIESRPKTAIDGKSKLAGFAGNDGKETPDAEVVKGMAAAALAD